jgi:hypothetical protein
MTEINRIKQISIDIRELRVEDNFTETQLRRTWEEVCWAVRHTNILGLWSVDLCLCRSPGGEEQKEREKERCFGAHVFRFPCQAAIFFSWQTRSFELIRKMRGTTRRESPPYTWDESKRQKQGRGKSGGAKKKIEQGTKLKESHLTESMNREQQAAREEKCLREAEANSCPSGLILRDGSGEGSGLRKSNFFRFLAVVKPRCRAGLGSD